MTGEARWTAEARRAHAWFLGRNDADAPLATPSGGCRDGIDRQGVSVNQGAESTLAWLHADAAMHLAGLPQETAPPCVTDNEKDLDYDNVVNPLKQR